MTNYPMKKIKFLSLFALMFFGSFKGQNFCARLFSRQSEIVSTLLILEAGGEGKIGMEAVLNVLNNRAKGDVERWEREALRKRQFSAFNRHTIHGLPLYVLINKAKRHEKWDLATQIVFDCSRGELKDFTHGSDHYYATWVKRIPYWAKSMDKTIKIGNHQFLKSN